jgi:hypothetical protein
VLPAVAMLTIQIVLAAGLYWLLMVRFGRSQYDQTKRMTWQLLGR